MRPTETAAAPRLDTRGSPWSDWAAAERRVRWAALVEAASWAEFLERYQATELALQSYVEGLPLWVNIWRGWMFCRKISRLHSIPAPKVRSNSIVSAQVTVGISSTR